MLQPRGDGGGQDHGAELLSVDEEPADADDGAVRAPAVWRVVTTFVLSLLGLGVSIYLTIDHFAKISPVCSGGGLVTCKKVTTSAQSYFLHIPVAMLGLVFYVVMVAINSPWAWRMADRRVHLARLALSVVGVCFALYLVACELLIIGNICLWCTSVHVITFVLFVIVVTTVPAMLGWGADRYADEYQEA